MKPARGSRVALFAFFYPLLAISIIQFLINVIEFRSGLSSHQNNALISAFVYLPPLVSFWRLDLTPLPKILNVPIIGIFYVPAMLYVGLFYFVITNSYIYGKAFYV